MNRSVCRGMTGVAGLAVLGMTTTLGGAQTVEVKEKPPLYRYVSYWAFPRAHWGDVDKDNATGGGSSSPLLVSSTKHWDQIYISRFYNWKAGSWKGAYGYAGTYKLKPDAPDADAQQLLRAGVREDACRRHNRRVRDRPGDDLHHRFATSVTF